MRKTGQMRSFENIRTYFNYSYKFRSSDMKLGSIFNKIIINDKTATRLSVFIENYEKLKYIFVID